MIKNTNAAVAERRRDRRVALFNEVECSFNGCMDKRPKRILDISVGGMYVEWAYPPPVGTPVELKFRIQGYDRPVVVKGEVGQAPGVVRAAGEVRHTQEGIGMGVLFTNIDPDVHAHIRRMINQIDTED